MGTNTILLYISIPYLICKDMTKNYFFKVTFCPTKLRFYSENSNHYFLSYLFKNVNGDFQSCDVLSVTFCHIILFIFV